MHHLNLLKWTQIKSASSIMGTELSSSVYKSSPDNYCRKRLDDQVSHFDQGFLIVLYLPPVKTLQCWVHYVGSRQNWVKVQHSLVVKKAESWRHWVALLSSLFLMIISMIILFRDFFLVRRSPWNFHNKIIYAAWQERCSMVRKSWTLGLDIISDSLCGERYWDYRYWNLP